MDYPKAKYHRSEAVRVVQGEQSEKDLGKEWFDTPNLTNTKEEVPAAPRKKPAKKKKAKKKKRGK